MSLRPIELHVLLALTAGPMHGYGVSRWIRRRTGGALEVEDAALYQALHRLERRGWLRSEWGRSENNRRAKYYSLTDKGREQLHTRAREARRYVKALTCVLDARGLGVTS